HQIPKPYVTPSSSAKRYMIYRVYLRKYRVKTMNRSVTHSPFGMAASATCRLNTSAVHSASTVTVRAGCSGPLRIGLIGYGVASAVRHRLAGQIQRAVLPVHVNCPVGAVRREIRGYAVNRIERVAELRALLAVYFGHGVQHLQQV